jgi:hypothetical protein
MWEPGRLTTLWASTACYRDSCTFTFYERITLFAEKQLISEGVNFLGRVINILEISLPEITKVKTLIIKVFSNLCPVTLQKTTAALLRKEPLLPIQRYLS